MTKLDAIKQIAVMRTKAASAGFSQSLINNGYPDHIVKQATLLYAAEGGLMDRRSRLIDAVRSSVMEKAARLRRYYNYR